MVRVGTTFEKGGIGGVVCLAALFFCVLTAACSDTAARSKPAASGPVILTVGYPHLLGTDPLNGLQQAARLISFEGLVIVARDGRARPSLAESWAHGADGMSLTMRLRSNAFFHDGTAVDADAVKQSLERSIATAESDLSPGLLDINSIDTPTPHEILIHLKRPSTFMLDDLTVVISKVGANGAPVGTGPFITTSTVGNEVVMRAANDYYKGKPNIDRIVWKAYPAVRTAWAAMMRGEIDALYEAGPEATEFMRGETSVNLFPFLRPYLFGVIFNSSRPEFKDRRVRRALNYAVDRNSIVSLALAQHGIPASGPAWPRHWAFDQSIPAFSYDPSRAAALLNAATLHRTVNKAGVPARLHFTCILPENFQLWERMALLVQRNLAEIDVDMQLETVSVDEFTQRIATRNFDAVLTEFVVGYNPSKPFFFWFSDSKRNVWGYKNPNMDEALDGIRRATNETEYRDAFRRFQIEGVDNPPAIFLALGETSRAVSKRFRVVSPPDSDLLRTIADWRLADDFPRATN
jgi:peptide/nickel transport system substrate-binding protein